MFGNREYAQVYGCLKMLYGMFCVCFDFSVLVFLDAINKIVNLKYNIKRKNENLLQQFTFYFKYLLVTFSYYDILRLFYTYNFKHKIKWLHHFFEFCAYVLEGLYLEVFLTFAHIMQKKELYFLPLPTPFSKRS